MSIVARSTGGVVGRLKLALQAKRVIGRLIRGFGITRTQQESGAMLPDGRLLDFSGRGRDPKYEFSEADQAFVPVGQWANDTYSIDPERSRSHDEMELIADPKGDEEGITSVESLFEQFGIIRLNGLHGIQMHRLPSDDQFWALSRYIKAAKDHSRITRLGLDIVVPPKDEWISYSWPIESVIASKVFELIRAAFRKCCHEGKGPCCPHKGKAK
jgi:hypothetical protein